MILVFSERFPPGDSEEASHIDGTQRTRMWNPDEQQTTQLTYKAGFDPTVKVEPFFAGMHTSSNPAASPHMLGAGFIRGHPIFTSMILPHNIVYHPTNHPKENWWTPQEF